MLGQPTAYVGQRVGQLSNCIAYCTKLESRKPGTEPLIKGQPRCLKQVKGERSDLNRAREIIQGHTTWTQVISNSACNQSISHPLQIVKKVQVASCRFNQLVRDVLFTKPGMRGGAGCVKLR